ncbi:MUC1 isoform 16 [Pan troglodytes]|uniref:Mucin-1 n=2 Tax=Pan troglodytes TaxID=9598 RepID=A0A2I3SZ59_PANTR|nr:mucin-1 isoform X15 [Pan troglodytes]PNI90608.1 MUC1 isoform 16 [Pan troglodytes]
MTPGIQSPFFLLLLLTVLTVVTGSGHASSAPGGEKETSATQRSSVPSSTEKNALSTGVSFFFLSFHISNLRFNSSLEDPSTDYYQELQRDISEMFLQIYKQGGFLGLSNIKFRPGSVVVQLTLAFREGTINVHDVETQFNQYKTEAASRYNLTISDVSGCLSVPPKELRAAGHLSSPGYLPSYERVPHLPHPWALCAP